MITSWAIFEAAFRDVSDLISMSVKWIQRFNNMHIHMQALDELHVSRFETYLKHSMRYALSIDDFNFIRSASFIAISFKSFSLIKFFKNSTSTISSNSFSISHHESLSSINIFFFFRNRLLYLATTYTSIVVFDFEKWNELYFQYHWISTCSIFFSIFFSISSFFFCSISSAFSF